MPSGVLWADTTRTSCAISNSVSASAAADMTDQSESLPMMTPTSGMPFSIREIVRGTPGARAHVVKISAQCSDVSDLATGPESLAVQVNLHIRPLRQAVVHTLVNASGFHVR